MKKSKIKEHLAVLGIGIIVGVLIIAMIVFSYDIHSFFNKILGV